MKMEQAYHMLVRPMWTEKTSRALESNWYTFEVAAKATKPMISEAVRRIYGVDVEAVNVVNKKIRHERTFRGVSRKRSAVKKAYIKLKAGQTIRTEGA